MTTLLDLPTEILLQISRLLCPHCVVVSQNRGGCTCHDERPKGASRLSQSDLLRQDLSRLSRTCRSVRAVAQPILYHSPKPILGYELLLARTLATNRELALAVKELHLGKWSVYEGDVTPDLQDLFNNVIERVGVPQKLLRELGGEWRRDWLVANEGARNPYTPYIPDITKPGDGKDFFSSRVRVVDALVVTLTPNVEHVHVQPLTVPYFPFCKPASLPRLTDLTLQMASPGGGGNSIDCVKDIIDAAPALERFRGVGINGMSWAVTHPGLRSLDLGNSALGATHLRAIMMGFPKLEVFGYEVDTHVGVGAPDERDALPREIGEALLLRKDTLKDVDLDLARSAMYRHRSRIDPDEAMRSLKEMEVLEELAVDRDAILVARELMPDGGGAGDDEDDEDDDGDGSSQDLDMFGRRKQKKKDHLLVDFLPRSIQYFKMYDRHGMLFPDVVELAAQTPEKFPNLKKVRFWGFDEDQRMALKGTFRRAGVKCYHGGYL